jgi:hypothetical protein
MKTPQATAKSPALKAANLPTVFISTPQTPSIITNDEESMEAIEKFVFVISVQVEIALG